MSGQTFVPRASRCSTAERSSLPPDVTVYGSWDAGYRTLAEETQFSVQRVDDAADAVRELIARIDAS